MLNSFAQHMIDTSAMLRRINVHQHFAQMGADIAGLVQTMQYPGGNFAVWGVSSRDILALAAGKYSATAMGLLQPVTAKSLAQV